MTTLNSVVLEEELEAKQKDPHRKGDFTTVIECARSTCYSSDNGDSMDCA